jgi:GGDEF domain-containing protein
MRDGVPVEVMTDTEQLNALNTTVNSYLGVLAALSDCVGVACPEVGIAYRNRLSRMRSRLAFDVTPEAVTDSVAVVERELKDYASKTATYINQHGVELRQAIDALEGIVKSIAQRQEFYGGRLRQFAAQMETTPYPSDPEHLSEVVSLQVAGLLGCVESMSNDTQSLLTRMRSELAAVTERLRESEVTDRLTGLMNRREMERRIEQRKTAGDDPVIIVFELSGDVRDEVAQQAAARLSSQFRHQDLICRWTEYEFLVLFQGSREIAQARTEQIIPWLAGRYPLDNGEVVEIRIDAGLVALHLLAMQ